MKKLVFHEYVNNYPPYLFIWLKQLSMGERGTGVRNVVIEPNKLWKYDLDQRCDYHWQKTFIDSVIFIMTSPTNSSKATVIFIIFWDFLMFCQIFLSPQEKRCVIISYKHGIHELPRELPNDSSENFVNTKVLYMPDRCSTEFNIYYFMLYLF